MVTGVNPRSGPLLPLHDVATPALASTSTGSRTAPRAPGLAARVSPSPAAAPRRRGHPAPAHTIVEMGDCADIDPGDPATLASAASLVRHEAFEMADLPTRRPEPPPLSFAMLPVELLLSILGHLGDHPPTRHAHALALSLTDKPAHASLEAPLGWFTLLRRATAVHDTAELDRFLQEVAQLEPHRRAPAVEALCTTALAHVVPGLPPGSSHRLRDAWRRMRADSERPAWSSVREVVLRMRRPDRTDAITAAVAALGVGVGAATGVAASMLAGTTAGAATGAAAGLAGGTTLGVIADRTKLRAMATRGALSTMLATHLQPMCDALRREMGERCVEAARATLPADGRARVAAALCRLDHGVAGRVVVTGFAVACLLDTEPLPDALRADLLDAVLHDPGLPADTFRALLPMLEKLPPQLAAGPWGNAWLHLAESQDRVTISRIVAEGGPLDELPGNQLAKALLPMLVCGPLFTRHHDITLLTEFGRLWTRLPREYQKLVRMFPFQPSRSRLAESIQKRLEALWDPMSPNVFESIAHIIGSVCRNPHSRTVACNDAATVAEGFAREKLVTALAVKVRQLPPSDRLAGIGIVAASLRGIATARRHVVIDHLLFPLAVHPELGGVPDSDLPDALRRVIEESSDITTLKTGFPHRLKVALDHRLDGRAPSPALVAILRGAR